MILPTLLPYYCSILEFADFRLFQKRVLSLQTIVARLLRLAHEHTQTAGQLNTEESNTPILFDRLDLKQPRTRKRLVRTTALSPNLNIFQLRYRETIKFFTDAAMPSNPARSFSPGEFAHRFRVGRSRLNSKIRRGVRYRSAVHLQV